jgi:acyl-CoA synthetase (AMP-forming)/AMP-acid ligase II
VARRIRPAVFYVMYGQTEATARLSSLPPELLEERIGSVGRGIPDVELQVVDDEGCPIAPGQVGHIRARGPNVMLGYWGDPEGTAQAIRGGWLDTGDLATIDEEGFIYPQGRGNALVKLSGFRVHPHEIEEFARNRLTLKRAVVIPIELPGSGTRLALFVQPDREARVSQQEVLRVCREGLPRHKVPVYVEVVDELPLNEALKLDQIGLRDRALEALRQRELEGTRVDCPRGNSL